jgi:hypothetical protein
VAVRVILADGITVFTYATAAVLGGGFLGVYEWNAATRKLSEITSFRLDAVAKAEVIRGGVVTQVIAGHAGAASDAAPSPQEPSSG